MQQTNVNPMVNTGEPTDGGTQSRLPQSTRPTLYSVPRRFDLATLLTVTLAYALLFAALRVLRFEPLVFGLVAGFFTAVAIGQALLFKGDSPRKASVLVGAVYWTGLQTLVGMAGVWSPCLAASFILWGGASGYVAGTLVAGVFLVADAVRRATTRPQDE